VRYVEVKGSERILTRGASGIPGSAGRISIQWTVANRESVKGRAGAITMVGYLRRMSIFAMSWFSGQFDAIVHWLARDYLPIFAN
jgi:hypothetical protein